MKRLLILSGKGGTGKTTTAAALIRLAKTQAAADCDVDAPNLHLVARQAAEPLTTDFLGGDKAVIDLEKCTGCGLCLQHCRFGAVRAQGGLYRVSEYACEGCGVCAHVCKHGAVTLQQDTAGRKELYLSGGGAFSTAALKMGRGNSGKLVAEVKLALLKHAPQTPLAVFDGSPGIGCPVMASVSGMDLVLIVAEPSLSGISDMKRLISTTRTFGTRVAVCVNKWDVSPAHTREIEAFCEAEQIPFAGKIPYDRRASLAVNAGYTLADTDGPAAEALRQIYEAVCRLLA